MKLRLKFGIVLVVVTLVLSGAIYGGLEFYKNDSLERNRASVEETTELAAEQIETTIVERKDYVGYVASQPEAAAFDRSGRLLDDVFSSTRFVAGQVVAANGTVVAFRGEIDRTVRRETIGSNVSDAAYFRGALNRSAHVSDPEFVAGTDQRLVVISAPIIRRGELRGVLALSIYVGDREFFNSIVPLDTTSRNVEVRADGVRLYGDDDRFAQATTASATVEPVGWTLTVSRDRSQLNAQLRSLAIAQGVGLFVVLLSVLSFGAWEYRENLQQTERLLDGFASLREGEYDHVLDLSTAEEWRQISDGFNELTAALEEREQRLRVLNRFLRHNVRNEMSVVLNYAELIGEFADDDRVGSAAAEVQSVGESFVGVMAKLRRLDTALEEPEGRVDLAPAVEAAVERVREEHPSARFDLDRPETAPVVAVPDVGFAVESVCENAVVHDDDPEPTVEVSVTRTGGPDPEVRVSVADDGPGIPEQELAVIEEGYETPLEHGSGLGLWIVHWIVAWKSDGEVEFEPNEPEGTVVTLVFDAA
jgi:signal transduction histidine kinase